MSEVNSHKTCKIPRGKELEESVRYAKVPFDSIGGKWKVNGKEIGG